MRRFAIAGPILGISLMLTGCAAAGSPQLASCLADHDVTAQFHAHPSRGKTLVGGLSADGRTVRCYWGDEHNAFVYFSTAWKACQRDENIECKYLANSERIVFAGHEKSFAKQIYAATSTGTTAGSGTGGVIWYLLGKFAEGLAMGYAQSQTQRTVYAVPSYEFNRPSYPRTRQTTAFKCSPQSAFADSERCARICLQVLTFQLGFRRSVLPSVRPLSAFGCGGTIESVINRIGTAVPCRWRSALSPYWSAPDLEHLPNPTGGGLGNEHPDDASEAYKILPGLPALLSDAHLLPPDIARMVHNFWAEAQKNDALVDRNKRAHVLQSSDRRKLNNDPKESWPVLEEAVNRALQSVQTYVDSQRSSVKVRRKERKSR